MFQRFKNAIDSLEEQARKPTPSVPPRGPPSGRRPQQQQQQQQQRPGRASQDVQRQSSDNLTGTTDPDPTTFDPDFVVGEETPSRANTPTGAPRASNTQPHTDENAEPKSAAEQEATPDEQDEGKPSQEVQSKLRRLTRLEAKYQDLLKAYRTAHARNSAIAPFEAKLRESTPLTSIADPDAFVEYLGQLSQRGDMVMDELKRVTGERDGLKKKLDAAEQETKKAFDEVAQLKQGAQDQPDASAARHSSEAAATDMPQAQRSPPVSSPSIKAIRSVFSPKSKPKTSTDDAEAGDLFSIDDEVPRLQSEIASRDERITTLETENHGLKHDLASTRESAEQMVQDLETAQSRLETIKHEHARSLREVEEQQKRSQDLLEDARAELETTQTRLGEKSEEVAQHSSRVKELESRLEDLSTAQASKETSTTKDDGRATDHAAQVSQSAAGSASTAKKNNKKKKKGKAGANSAETNADKPSTDNVKSLNGTSDEASDAQKRLEECLKELEEKTAAVERLQAKLKDQQDLVDEIENLKDELMTIGGEHVEAKDRIKQLLEEKQRPEGEARSREGDESADTDVSELKNEIEEIKKQRSELQQKAEDLEKRLNERSKTKAAEDATADADRAKLQKEASDLKTKLKSVETDLSASQSLASNRFKEIQTLKERVQKMQPELGALRTEVNELRKTKTELSTSSAEIRKLEARGDNLRAEIESFKKRIADKDGELRSLNEKLGQETSRRLAFEETGRKTQRELERAQGERNEAATARDSLQSRFESSDRELRITKDRLQHLEGEVGGLRRDANSLREEIELKSAQYASAQSLMNSVRDQAGEMAVQMKEAQARCESLEEELTDAHRLMNERGREGETMRRLLSDVEGRADARIKDMKERMEVAIQERDRAEDEASSSGRRRAREVEDLRNKARDAERDLKRLQDDKSDIDRVAKELRRQREEDLRKADLASQELTDVKKAMGELRDALDEGEKQARDLDVEKADARRALEETQARLEKLQKTNKTMSDELRSLKANRIRPMNSPSSRSSVDGASPARVTSPNPAGGAPSRTPTSGSGGSGMDYVYLKNVLLQFLEQRDKKYQMQLVPVLGQILHFDKADEQRWAKVVNSR